MPSRLTVVLVSLLLATPAVIFWLWLVIVPASVAVLCPEECQCDLIGHHVSCYGPSLTTVPSIRLTGVETLDVNNCKVTLFERDYFLSRGLTELEILTVWQCELEIIELGAFKGLTKLTLLSIGENEISEITPGTFEHMSSLEILDLGYNRLQHLDSAVFSGLVNLNYIDLGGNELQYLHPDTFSGLPNLQRLNLDRNPGLQIPTDRNFINSHSLSFLDISGCNVRSVSVETFANVRALEELDLSYNNLSSIDINILIALPELSALYLDGNPLQCDCQLQKVRRLCEDHNIETTYGEIGPECDTPSEVKGVWWGVLEKGQCLQDNIQYYGDYKNTSYNSPEYEVPYTNEYDVDLLTQYQVPVYALPFIFGTTGNVILLITIICNKDMRTRCNMYILNLAISDIIYLTVLFSEACANRISDTWLDGDFMCTFLPFCRRLSFGLLAYSLAVLSIQRYSETMNTSHARVSSQPTLRVTVATICGVWIVAALFAVPSDISKYLCEDFVVLGGITYYKRVVIFELLVSCVLPTCVIAFCYVMTARHLVESSFCTFEETQNPQLNTRRNTAKIVVGLAVVFMISYVPYHILWTYIICSEEEGTYYFKISDVLLYSNYELQYMYLISTCFLFINPCVIPVALFWISHPFGQHLKRFLTSFSKTNSPPTDLELARRY